MVYLLSNYGNDVMLSPFEHASRGKVGRCLDALRQNPAFNIGVFNGVPNCHEMRGMTNQEIAKHLYGRGTHITYYDSVFNIVRRGDYRFNTIILDVELGSSTAPSRISAVVELEDDCILRMSGISPNKNFVNVDPEMTICENLSHLVLSKSHP